MKWILIALAFLTGCSTLKPCTWYGEKISQHEANEMKAMGMTVHCPGDEP